MKPENDLEAYDIQTVKGHVVGVNVPLCECNMRGNPELGIEPGWLWIGITPVTSSLPTWTTS